jgi:hypothetical protein
MSGRCETCDAMSSALADMEAMRLRHDALVDAYQAVCEQRDLMTGIADLYNDLYNNLVQAAFAEAEQYRTLPEHLALPLLTTHGFKLALVRLTETEPSVLARYRELVETLERVLPQRNAAANIVAFPHRM